MADNAIPTIGAVPSTRPYRGIAPAERIAQRRACLIETAVRVIGTRGFAATSLNEICREAQLTKRYFYESFSSLEQLLCEAYRQVMADNWPTILEAVAQADATPEARMTAALSAYFDLIRRDRQFGRLVLVEILGVCPEGDVLYADNLRLTVALTRERVCEGLPMPGPADLSLDMLLGIHLGGVYQMAKEWLLDDCRESPEVLVKHLIAVFNGMIAEWSARASAQRRRRGGRQPGTG